MDEMDFLPADKHQRFLQIDTISLQYPKKEVSDEVDFSAPDKHEGFLQIDSMIFNGDGQAFPKFTK